MYQKRRKKRLSRGVKVLDLHRGRNGYGFTISGQQPCVLSCIVSGSTAEEAGLRPGDFLLSVNHQDVSQALHDDVVRLIGSSTGILTLQIAENIQSSDSSDDEFQQRTKSKYQSKHRRSTQRAERVLNDVQSGAIFTNERRRHRRRAEDPSTPKRDEYGGSRHGNLPTTPLRYIDTLPVMSIIIGYIGSVDIPSGSRQPIRNAVRRLRMEHRNYTLILMQVLSHEIKLMDNIGSILAIYPAERLAYAGACPDDKRYFSLVTRVTPDSSSSCHMFMIDTELTLHQLHSGIAKNFGLVCTPDMETRLCLEFPQNADAVICVISNLYKQYCQSLFEIEKRRSNSNASSNSEGSTPRGGNNVFVVDLDRRREAWKHERQVSSASSGSHRSDCPDRTCSPHDHMTTAACHIDTLLQTSRNDVLRVRNEEFLPSSGRNEEPRTPKNEAFRNKKVKGESAHVLDVQSSADNIRQKSRRYVSQNNELDNFDEDSIGSDPFHFEPMRIDDPAMLWPPVEEMEEKTDPDRKPFTSKNRRQSDGVFSGFKKPSTKPLRALPRPHGGAGEGKLKPSLSHESLAKAVIDDEALNRSARMLPSNSMDSVADASLRPEYPPSVSSAAASWALGLDKLLDDSMGLAAFMTFLKKEFSEENLVFWIACEQYKKLTSQDQRSFRGQEIFAKHLAVRAVEPVNVDSQARNKTQADLAQAGVDLFEMAQLQIWQLMKHDSYSRFIKSDVYKECVLAEMEGRQLPYDPIEIHSENSSKTGTLDRRKKDEEGKKRSFFPWRVRPKKSSNKENEEQKKSAVKSKEDSPKKTLSKQSSSSSVSRKSENDPQSMEDQRKDAEFRERLETVAPVKVVLPDGSTSSTVVSAGVTVRMAIRKICDRKNLPIIAIDVFQLGSDKVLDLDADISLLGAKEIVIEKRTLFRLDFPNKKSIGVKAKPNRTAKDVLRPILQKYEYSLDSVHVYVNGLPVNLKGPVSSLDNQRVVVQTQEDYEEWGRYDPGTATKPPLPNNRPRSMSGGPLVGPLDEPPHRMFEDIVTPGVTNRFDELGVLDKDAPKEDSRKSLDQKPPLFVFRRRNSLGEKDKPSRQQKPKSVAKAVTSKMNNIKITDPDGEYFLDLLSRAQSNRIDDQRGLSSDQFELPDFLKPENSPRPPGENPNPYVIENAVSTPDIRTIGSQNRSFSEDCILPDHHEAENFFLHREFGHNSRTMDHTGISMSPPPLARSEFELTISETPEANYPPPPEVLDTNSNTITTSTPILSRKAPPLPEKRWRRNRPLDLEFVDSMDNEGSLPSPSTHVLITPREYDDRRYEQPDVDVKVTFV